MFHIILLSFCRHFEDIKGAYTYCTKKWDFDTKYLTTFGSNVDAFFDYFQIMVFISLFSICVLILWKKNYKHDWSSKAKKMMSGLYLNTFLFFHFMHHWAITFQKKKNRQHKMSKPFYNFHKVTQVFKLLIQLKYLFTITYNRHTIIILQNLNIFMTENKWL